MRALFPPSTSPRVIHANAGIWLTSNDQYSGFRDMICESLQRHPSNPAHEIIK